MSWTKAIPLAYPSPCGGRSVIPWNPPINTPVLDGGDGTVWAVKRVGKGGKEIVIVAWGERNFPQAHRYILDQRQGIVALGVEEADWLYARQFPLNEREQYHLAPGTPLWHGNARNVLAFVRIERGRMPREQVYTEWTVTVPWTQRHDPQAVETRHFGELMWWLTEEEADMLIAEEEEDSK